MIAFLKKHRVLILEILFLSGVFLISIVPLRDFDIWFHLKSGEVILRNGLIHYDVFSHHGSGREWFPYEWLFQAGSYLYALTFGFDALKFLVAALATIQTLLLFLILKKIFRLNFLLSTFCCIFFLAGVFDFISARPHIVAYTFLLAELTLIYLYYFKGKNLLFLSLPITLVWTNLHGSMFLGVYLFGSYGGLCLLQYLSTKDNIWRHKCKTLSIFTFINGLLTITPPLYFLQYRLLWQFFLDRDFISKFIDEWTPLYVNPAGFWIYTATVILILGYFALCIRGESKWKSVWVLPLLPFIALAYLASRNSFLGNISLSLILAFSLTKLSIRKYDRKIKTLMIILFVSLAGFNFWIISQKNVRMQLYYPVHATQFLKDFHLAGNMFNEYGYGGYLLFHLYPDYKVFFDGRTDVYLCCEMRDAFNIAIRKYWPDDRYEKYLYDNLWNKYDISYVILRTEKHTMIRKITRLLNSDPNWSLVFWDDYTQIFVRRDGKNDKLIESLGARYATPYLRDPFPQDKREEAYTEYLRMEKVVKSARTSNAIGFILMQKGDVSSAQKRFEEAIKLDNNFESPYMNLAEIAAGEKDYYRAIELYKTAQKLAIDRGLIYIRMGQLFISGYNDYDKAKIVWQAGIKNTVDEDAKKKLQELLQTLK